MNEENLPMGGQLLRDIFFLAEGSPCTDIWYVNQSQQLDEFTGSHSNSSSFYTPPMTVLKDSAS